MMIVAYLDRVNISVAGPTIMASEHLSKGQFAGVLSAFQLGYALMQIPGGLVADLIGSKPLLIIALLVWSCFTAVTGATRSLAQLIGVRVLFGFGEGIENGAQFKLIGDNFSSAERSNANAFFLTALALGPAIGSPIVTWLIEHVGWRGLFYWSALPGLIVAGLLLVFLPSQTLAAPVSGKGSKQGKDSANWGDVVARPTSWLAFLAYFFFNVGFWGFVGWMPSYLSETRHILLKDLGTTASIPYMCGFVGMLFIGRLGATSFRGRRAMLVSICYLLAAAGLFVAYQAGTVNGCLTGLSVAAFFLYGGFGPFWAVVLDLSPPELRAGFTGFVNVGGQVGGFVAPLAVGWIFDATKSYSGGFLFMMGGLALAAGSLALLGKIGPRNAVSDVAAHR